MAEERDAAVSAAYRELGAEEPPRALDEAILGAARRSVRPWTQRWAVPLSLAAVVVLSVTVTLRIQHEQPGIQVPAPAPVPAQARDEARVARQPAEPVKPAAEPVAQATQQKSMTRKESEAFPRSSQDRAVAENRAAAAAPAAVPQAAPAAAKEVEAPALAKRADADAVSVAESAAGSVAPAPAPAAAAPAMRAMQRERSSAERTLAGRPALAPEQELERIADLRKQAKHDEADKALAEFRKRYPDFKIPAPMLERVERR